MGKACRAVWGVGLSLVAAGVALAQENVVLDQGVSVYPIVERLTMHYVEHLVEKPKNNEELLRLYKIAFKNFERTVMETENSEYNLDLIAPGSAGAR